jgi:hypothetical protein
VNNRTGVDANHLSGAGTATVASLAAPSAVDVEKGLAQVLGEEGPMVWSDICAQAHVGPAANTIDGTDLDRLLDVLAAQSRLCAVLAMSWRIRRTAAQRLAELGR